MYKKSQIIDCLYGVVGFRQTEHPDFPSLLPSLLNSSSGRYFEDEHPLISIENIDQCFKNYSSYTYPAWAVGTTYLEGVRVDYAGTTYESLISANVGNQPDISPAAWESVNELSKKLEWLVKSSLDDVVSNMFIEKKLNQVTKSIFENVQIFDGVGNIQNKAIKQGRFVGIMIELNDHTNLSLIIESIGLQISAANPALNLYLFHSSDPDPVTTWNVNYTNAGRFQWFDADKTELKRFDSTKDYGGFWIIGYYEDDLIGQAINKDYNFGMAPHCGTCNNNYAYWEKWSRFARYTPISVQSDDLVGILPSDPGGAKLWDLNEMSSNHYTENWGINIDLTAKCDVSDMICKQKDLFSDAIRKEVAFRLLKELAYNTRNNAISKEVADQALYELNTKENPTGFMNRYNKTMKAINFDLSDMNDACLPCNNKYSMSSGKV